MTVRMGGHGGQGAYVLGQYIVDQMPVIDPDNLFHGIRDPSMPPDLPFAVPVYYHRPPRARLEATLRLLSLFDRRDMDL